MGLPPPSKATFTNSQPFEGLMPKVDVANSNAGMTKMATHTTLPLRIRGYTHHTSLNYIQNTNLHTQTVLALFAGAQLCHGSSGGTGSEGDGSARSGCLKFCSPIISSFSPSSVLLIQQTGNPTERKHYFFCSRFISHPSSPKGTRSSSQLQGYTNCNIQSNIRMCCR